jgi:N-methylhydantoinase B
MSNSQIDPVTMEILWNRLNSVVDEAAAAFVRTSFSTLVREANDYAVVLTNANGHSMAQSSMSIPSFISTLPRSVRHFLDVFPSDEFEAGDVLITNDPWFGTGHIHDVTTAMPLFYNGKLVAFSAATSHVPDIGGPVRNSDIGSIYEEGLQIPALKLARGGKIDKAVQLFIERNVRVPEQTMGDIWGQVAAHNMLQSRLTTLLDDSDVSVEDMSFEIFSRSEKAIREAISVIPDGEYSYMVRNDGFDSLVEIDCTVIVKGDRIHVDYEGTSAQIEDKSVNVVEAYTFAYTVFALKALLAPDIPNNEGFFAPFTVEAPKGSVLNAQHPVATGARGQIGHLLPVAVIGAMNAILPGDKRAEGSGNSVCTITGEDGGISYAVANFINAGQGATSKRNGYSCVCFPSNLGNLPIEVFESEVPALVKWKRFRHGSGGTGAHNGGNGQSFSFEFRGEIPARCSFLMPKREVAPKGIEGGNDGAMARLVVNGKQVAPYEVKSLRNGDVVLMETAGGGGFGKPL